MRGLGLVSSVRFVLAQVAHDHVAQKDFLLCDYNRDGDSYRCEPENFKNTRIRRARVPGAAELFAGGGERRPFLHQAQSPQSKRR